VLESGAHLYDLMTEEVEKDLLKGLEISISKAPEKPKAVPAPLSRKSIRERTVALGKKVLYAVSLDWVSEWLLYKGDRYQTTPIREDQQGVQIIIQKKVGQVVNY
jgi:hypothetical protein